MRSRPESARKRAYVSCALFCAGSVAAAIGALTAASAQTQTRELSPAQVVAYRFPPNWNPSHAAAPAPKAATAGGERQRVASLMFSPQPSTYSLASASSEPMPAGLPDSALAYADPAAANSAAAAPAHPAEKRAAPAPAPKVAKPSNKVLNDAQIASIKTRLNLTPDQQRYWPAVEAALRNIAYQKDAAGATKGASAKRLAAVDPNSAGVQQLKSAAFPLIMSFNDDQKSEVRQLARLMGLEQVAASF
jgi:hypothetical protein